MKPIVIAGAGITGCTVAYKLAGCGYKVILLEKESQIGGLARSFRYGDFTFDIGPHRFFTKNDRILNFITGVLEDEYTLILRNSSVYFSNKYYIWPLRPTVLLNLPLALTMKAAWELVHMALKKRWKDDENNFESYILKHYGPTLYNIFFKEYTQKFLGISPIFTDSKWAKDAMQRTIIDEELASRNLKDILKLIFKFRPITTKFIYPANGIGNFCDNLLQNSGVELHTNVVISQMAQDDNKIKTISFNDRVVEAEQVIWTASINDACRLLNVSDQGLKYRSLLIFNLELNTKIQQKFQWCYYGDKTIFSRVTNPAMFSKDLVPLERESLCIEVTCDCNDKYWNDPEQLVDLMIRDLIKVKLIGDKKDVAEIHTVKVSNAYPVYELNFSEKLSAVKKELSRIKNFQLAGRTGLFWYNNMDDSIENGLTIADIISNELKNEKIVIRK